MGMVCENCGWRKVPSYYNSKGCIFSNANRRKKWDMAGYNSPCDKYITDSELREHLKKLLRLDDKDTSELEAENRRLTAAVERTQVTLQNCVSADVVQRYVAFTSNLQEQLKQALTDCDNLKAKVKELENKAYDDDYEPSSSKHWRNQW